MLVTSTSVFPAHSVITSQKMLILGFGTAVKSIVFGTISSRADAKSVKMTMIFDLIRLTD